MTPEQIEQCHQIARKLFLRTGELPVQEMIAVLAIFAGYTDGLLSGLSDESKTVFSKTRELTAERIRQIASQLGGSAH